MINAGGRSCSFELRLCVPAAGAVCGCDPGPGTAGRPIRRRRSSQTAGITACGVISLRMNEALLSNGVCGTHRKPAKFTRLSHVCLQPAQPAQHLFLIGGNNAADWLDTVDIFTVCFA